MAFMHVYHHLHSRPISIFKTFSPFSPKKSRFFYPKKRKLPFDIEIISI